MKRSLLIVMLLLTLDHACVATPTLTPSWQHASGLSLTSMAIRVHIRGSFAETHETYTFDGNDEGDGMARFNLTLPPGAVVTSLASGLDWLGEPHHKLYRGKLFEIGYANHILRVVGDEDIRRQLGHDKFRRGSFSTWIETEHDSISVVEITFIQRLPTTGGVMVWTRDLPPVKSMVECSAQVQVDALAPNAEVRASSSLRLQRRGNGWVSEPTKVVGKRLQIKIREQGAAEGSTHGKQLASDHVPTALWAARYAEREAQLGHKAHAVAISRRYSVLNRETMFLPVSTWQLFLGEEALRISLLKHEKLSLLKLRAQQNREASVVAEWEMRWGGHSAALDEVHQRAEEFNRLTSPLYRRSDGIAFYIDANGRRERLRWISENCDVSVGDPLLAVMAPADADVMAIFPEGRHQRLFWDTARRRWTTRFDIPTCTPLGPYVVDIAIRTADGARHTLLATFHVGGRADTTTHVVLPSEALVAIRGRPLLVHFPAGERTQRVVVQAPWGEQTLYHRNTAGEFEALVVVPPAFKPGRVVFPVVIIDRAHGREVRALCVDVH